MLIPKLERLEANDDDIAEARRRDADLEKDPALAISLEQLDERIRASSYHRRRDRQ